MLKMTSYDMLLRPAAHDGHAIILPSQELPQTHYLLMGRDGDNLLYATPNKEEAIGVVCIPAEFPLFVRLRELPKDKMLTVSERTGIPLEGLDKIAQVQRNNWDQISETWHPELQHGRLYALMHHTEPSDFLP